MTLPHFGIVLTVLGTVLLAFSLKVPRQYDGPMGEAVERMRLRDRGLFVPTETRIVRCLFWAGLLLIGVGAACQW